jgi:hypothetical protein
MQQLEGLVASESTANPVGKLSYGYWEKIRHSQGR